MLNPHEIDLRAPVEPGHPLNRGRRLWLLGHPYLAGGQTWYDLCGRANGALTNGPAWAATGRGDAGPSLVAASSQYADCAAADAAVTAASQVVLGLWVRRTAGTGSYFSRGGASSRFGLTWFTDNVLYCIADTGSGAAFGSVSLGALTGWHRLVLAWDGTATGNAARMRAWVNGVPRTLAYTGTIPAALQTTGQTLAVGRSWTTAAVYATGPHADASVWLGRQWSDVDAAADYDLSRRGYPGSYGPLRRVSNRGFLLLREADAGGGSATTLDVTPAAVAVAGSGAFGVGLNPTPGAATLAGSTGFTLTADATPGAATVAGSAAFGVTLDGTPAAVTLAGSAGFLLALNPTPAAVLIAGTIDFAEAGVVVLNVEPASITLAGACAFGLGFGVTPAAATIAGGSAFGIGLGAAPAAVVVAGTIGLVWSETSTATPRTLAGTWEAPTLTGTWEARSLTGTWE